MVEPDAEALGAALLSAHGLAQLYDGELGLVETLGKVTQRVLGLVLALPGRTLRRDPSRCSHRLHNAATTPDGGRPYAAAAGTLAAIHEGRDHQWPN